jgi:hypothetical protein
MVLEATQAQLDVCSIAYKHVSSDCIVEKDDCIEMTVNDGDIMPIVQDLMEIDNNFKVLQLNDIQRVVIEFK